MLDQPPADAPALLQALPCVAKVLVDENRFEIAGTADSDLSPAVYGLAVAESWRVRELRPVVQTLESVFNQMMSSTDRANRSAGEL